MSFETKEEVLRQVLSHKKPRCPHCRVEMGLWEVPQIPFEEGSGWGTPYLFVCFNNDCPMYRRGWDHLMENYGHRASYRCICYPGTNTFDSMVVFSAIGGTGQIIDDQIIAKQKELQAAVKIELSALSDCYAHKDWQYALKILLDPVKTKKVRLRAAEIIGDIGELRSIEPIKNHKFKNASLSSKIKESVKKIHQRHFTRECPFCAEIIKKRSRICKHCGRLLPDLRTDSRSATV